MITEGQHGNQWQEWDSKNSWDLTPQVTSRAELALTSEPSSQKGRSQRLCSAMASLIILIP